MSDDRLLCGILSEAELLAEFDRLFPHGFAGPDVLQELAPAGWESSPLAAVFTHRPRIPRGNAGNASQPAFAAEAGR